MSETPAPGPTELDPALQQLQAALQGVDALPVADRVDTFERINDGIARELARLDEV